MKSHYCFSLLLSGFVLLPAGWGQTSQPTPPKPAPTQTGILLVRGDKAASLSIDGKNAGDLAAGGFLKVSAVAGEHFIEAVEKDGACKWEKKVTIPAGMQVAEEVDFATACPLKPDAGAPAPSSANVASPPIAAPPAVVDPKIQEAQDLHERGCLLHFLGRESEAVPLLEKAASIMPSIEIDDTCLKFAREKLKFAQEKLAACENSPSSMEKTGCRYERVTWGYELGDMGGFSTLNRDIQDSERNQRSLGVVASADYENRALFEYALGNPIDALRDLQTALDRERDQVPRQGATIEQTENIIDLEEARIYIERALIQASIGNEEAAGLDCRMAIAHKVFPGEDEFVVNFCTRLATAPASPDSGKFGNNASAPQDSHGVDNAIKRIQGGQFSPMPQPQVIMGGGSGPPRLTIENDTQYEVQVYLSGPEIRSVSIPSGGTSVLDLPAGAFKLAAEIPNSSVVPFYGEQTFSSGIAYMEKFYIQRVQ